MSEFQKMRLACAHGPDTHFEGVLIREYTTQNSAGTKDRWTELRLWETRGRQWIAESVGCSSRGGEREIRQVTVIGPGAKPNEPIQWKVMEAFGWTSAAKAFAREMGWDVVRRVE